jgi:alpha-1,6-mannosyltransferase
VRIVRIANFVTPKSGGLRTALRHLGTGYERAGHESVLIVPGPEASEEQTEQGLVITLPGPRVPGMGGYRMLLGRRRTSALLRDLRPDRVEVSDRTSLRWVGGWARKRDVPSMMVSHESLDGLLRLFGPTWSHRVTDNLNGRTAAEYDRIVCTTQWAAAEFERIDAPNVSRVPLGVDLDRFSPSLHDPVLRARWAKPSEMLLLHCGRLSAEKKPRRSLETVAALRTAGVPAVLVVAGSGPLLPMMRAEAEKRGLPVCFLGFLGDPALLGALLATADVVIAPGPVETFGLAALEALASGTPVVASAESALAEVIGPAGVTAPGDGPAYADAVLTLMDRPAELRRRAAREQAERFPWAAAVDGFLSAHGAARVRLVGSG